MPHILLIMRKPGNLRVLASALEGHGHQCRGADSQAALYQLLTTESRPDLALVDLSGFGESAWPMCETLQQSDIPFVVLSTHRELGVNSKSLSYGAKSILEKPIVKKSLLQLIRGLTEV